MTCGNVRVAVSSPNRRVAQRRTDDIQLELSSVRVAEALLTASEYKRVLEVQSAAVSGAVPELRLCITRCDTPRVAHPDAYMTSIDTPGIGDAAPMPIMQQQQRPQFEHCKIAYQLQHEECVDFATHGSGVPSVWELCRLDHLGAYACRRRKVACREHFDIFVGVCDRRGIRYHISRESSFDRIYMYATNKVLVEAYAELKRLFAACHVQTFNVAVPNMQSAAKQPQQQHGGTGTGMCSTLRSNFCALHDHAVALCDGVREQQARCGNDVSVSIVAVSGFLGRITLRIAYNGALPAPEGGFVTPPGSPRGQRCEPGSPQRRAAARRAQRHTAADNDDASDDEDAGPGNNASGESYVISMVRLDVMRQLRTFVHRRIDDAARRAVEAPLCECHPNLKQHLLRMECDATCGPT